VVTEFVVEGLIVLRLGGWRLFVAEKNAQGRRRNEGGGEEGRS